MKDIFLKALVLLFVVGIFTACEEEELEYQPTTGAAAFVANQSGFFDLNNSTNEFSFDLVRTEGDAVNTIDIYKSLNSGAEVYHATVNAVPSTIQVNLNEALADIPNVTIDSLSPGDIFYFVMKLNTGNGTYTSQHRASSVVSCSSSVGGAYTSVARGTSTDSCCPGEFAGRTSVVNITADPDLPEGNYIIDDFSGSIYLEWYAVYGLTDVTDSPADVLDVCNTLTLSGTEPFGEWITGSGTRDANTGVIEYHWDNGWGDEGDVTLTPQ